MDTFDLYDQILDEDPGRCADCGAPFQWVRPGKSQSTCECDLKCPIHGPGAIQYHPVGHPVPNMGGWFCLQCMGPNQSG